MACWACFTEHRISYVFYLFLFQLVFSIYKFWHPIWLHGLPLHFKWLLRSTFLFSVLLHWQIVISDLLILLFLKENVALSSITSFYEKKSSFAFSTRLTIIIFLHTYLILTWNILSFLRYVYDFFLISCIIGEEFFRPRIDNFWMTNSNQLTKNCISKLASQSIPLFIQV